jgi:ABC-type transport system involved in multi-copper enzyme maturation permease subunit
MRPAVEMLASANLLASYLTDRPWIVSLLFVAGLLIYGFRDVLRLNLGRIWAISSVCFRDAIRRRVLWITPLAMLGIVIVSQLQKPENEQDAIRLTIKFCFFATAVVVMIIAIITAATNLPREIENRVIFTIVVKPVSRLEIIIGKIVGFARVSGTILLIMGLFALAYLHLRAYTLGRQVAATLESPSIDASTRDRLRHYQDQGLLLSQKMDRASQVMQYARLTEGKTLDLQGSRQDATGIFTIDPGSPPAAIVVQAGYEKIAESDTSDLANSAAGKPAVAVQIADGRGNTIIPADQMPNGGKLELPDASGTQPATLLLDEQQMNMILQSRDKKITVRVVGHQSNYLFKFNQETGVALLKADAEGKPVMMTSEQPLLTRGAEARAGQQLRGPSMNLQPVQVFSFREAAPPLGKDVPFELTVGIERGGADSDGDEPTTLEVVVFDRTSKTASPPQIVFPENRETVYFNLPADFLKNGEFDVRLTNRTAGHVIAVVPTTITRIGGTEYFGFNLFKGLLVIWLLSILTSIIALFCSTFLSWPIAVVLTLLVILGRWVVANLDIGTGLGSQFATEFFPTNATGSKVVSNAVDTLANTLMSVAAVLPDLSSFGVTEQIERGVMIAPQQLLLPLLVVLIFGVPFAIVAYVFLRNKEVAP